MDEDGTEKIEIRFPYNKKLIQLIRCIERSSWTSYELCNIRWRKKEMDIYTL